MIVNQSSGKPVYEAENWQEKFKIGFSGVLWHGMAEGSPLPRWFLPVKRGYNMDVIECWIFPLAPFVLAFSLIRNAFWSIWEDLFKWNDLVFQWRNKKQWNHVSNKENS